MKLTYIKCHAGIKWLGFLSKTMGKKVLGFVKKAETSSFDNSGSIFLNSSGFTLSSQILTKKQRVAVF